MARRRHQEEHVNHEAWAIPYGDLITLLLAFFVVMYALSSVNEGKYRVLSDSLVAAFRAPPKSLDPIQIGEIALSQYELDMRQERTLVPLELDAIVPQHDEDDLLSRDLDVLRRAGLSAGNLDVAAQMIEELADVLTAELQELIDRDLVRVRQDRYWLEIEINTSLLFASASAQLSDDSIPVVRRLGAILAGNDARVHVEGHTDVRPIATARFPSNWELSAARSSTVVRMFAEAGVSPDLLAAVGYGEFRPVADNATEAGRSENRRVVIVVMANRDEGDGDGADRVRQMPAMSQARAAGERR